jgi:CheY-like chemotaxis protein
VKATRNFGLKVVFIFAIVSLAALSFYGLRSFNKSLELGGWVTHTDQVVIELRTLRRFISEAQEKQSLESLKRLRQLVADNDLQLGRVRDLELGLPKIKKDEIVSMLGEMEDEENQLRKIRAEAFNEQTLRAKLFLFLSMAFGLTIFGGLSFAFLRQLNVKQLVRSQLAEVRAKLVVDYVHKDEALKNLQEIERLKSEISEIGKSASPQNHGKNNVSSGGLEENSTFWFSLKTKKNVTIREKLHGRVLVAEDNPMNQKVLLEILENLGLKAHLAENGNEVIEALKESSFDLILMDCHMPERDGYETAVKIRTSKKSPYHDIPIIALTTNALKTEKEKCTDVGMNDCLAKPIEEARLYAILKTYLSVRQVSEENPMKSVDINVLNQLRMLQIEGQPDIVRDRIKNYLQDAPVRIEKIEIHLKKKDLQNAREEAQALRSNSRTLGALTLGAFCQELEASQVFGDLTLDIFKKVSKEFNNVRDEMTAFLEKNAQRAS